MIYLFGATGRLGSHIQDEDIVRVTHTMYDIVHDNWVSLQPHSIMINCAAYTDVCKAESEPEVCFDVNVKGVFNLVKLAKEYKCRLVHISTDHVFGNSKGGLYTEEEPPTPVGTYAVTKYLGEEVIKHSGLDNYLIIRTSFMNDFTFNKAFINKYFSALKVEKLAEYVLLASKWWDITGTFNIGYPYKRSVFELAKQFNKDVEPMFLEENPTNKVGLSYIPDTSLDSTKWFQLLKSKTGRST